MSGLGLFPFGGDPKDPTPEIEHLPAMRAAVGEIPIMISCPFDVFLSRMDAGTLPPNVRYVVHGEPISVEMGTK